MLDKFDTEMNTLLDQEAEDKRKEHIIILCDDCGQSIELCECLYEQTRNDFYFDY